MAILIEGCIKIIYVNIEKTLGNFKLEVNFESDSGVLALLGASGCGKSMTLKCIAGIETPDTGKIILNDKVLFDSENKINLPPQERNVGLLFQNYALFPNLTLRQNIEIGLRDKNKHYLIDDYITKFSLNGLEKNYPNELSGGQQQRAALARMLINEPDIIMLDEPFSALDQHLRWAMEKELSDIIKEFNGNILYVSHNKNEVYRLCDQISIMHEGSIVESDSKFNIFSHPKTLSSAVLIGIKNISKINYIQSSIEATDWDLIFDKTLLDINNSLLYNYIAIKETDIQIKSNIEQNNTFEIINIIDEIENKLIIASRNDKLLHISISKKSQYKIGDIISLDFPKDSLIFLD